MARVAEHARGERAMFDGMTSRALLAVLGVAVAAGAIALWFAVREPAAPTPAPSAPAGGASSTNEPARPHPQPAVVSDARAPATPHDDRTQLLETLRASGSAEEEWTTRGSALLAQLSRAATAVLDSGCFVAGCGAIYTFASEDEYRRHRAALEASPEYRAWTGGKRWTEPERDPDGHARIGFFLYRPD